MKNLSFPLLIALVLSGCMTETDKAIWAEAKEHLSSSDRVAEQPAAVPPAKTPTLEEKMNEKKPAKEAKAIDQTTPQESDGAGKQDQPN